MEFVIKQLLKVYNNESSGDLETDIDILISCIINNADFQMMKFVDKILPNDFDVMIEVKFLYGNTIENLYTFGIYMILLKYVIDCELRSMIENALFRLRYPYMPHVNMILNDLKFTQEQFYRILNTIGSLLNCYNGIRKFKILHFLDTLLMNGNFVDVDSYIASGPYRHKQCVLIDHIKYRPTSAWFHETKTKWDNL